MRATWCATLLVLCLSLSGAAAVSLKHKLQSKNRASASVAAVAAERAPTSKPRATFGEFAKTGVMPGDDFFSQVKVLLEGGSDSRQHNADAAIAEPTVFMEVGASVGTKKVQSFCEICILVMQMKERGQPHLCAGLNDQYYVTCVEVLISLLRADKALVYWLKNGCMHMDQTGPEIVRPCPAINICSWVPNLFSQPPSIVRDGVESLCPKDNKFLPTIPQEYKSLIPSDKTSD